MSIISFQEVRALSSVSKAKPKQNKMFLLPVFMSKNAISILFHKIAHSVHPYMLVPAAS